jgi:hypothetical protein
MLDNTETCLGGGRGKEGGGDYSIAILCCPNNIPAAVTAVLWIRAKFINAYSVNCPYGIFPRPVVSKWIEVRITGSHELFFPFSLAIPDPSDKEDK